MPIVTRVAALTALSALAACGTATTAPEATVTIDVSALLASLDTYDAVTTDAQTNTDAALRDDTLPGVTGFMSFSDGTVEPIRVRMSSDATKAYLSVGGGEEIELTISSAFPTQLNWTSDEGTVGFQTDTGAPSLQIWSQHGEVIGRGYYGLQSTVADLPSDSATYSGTYFMSGIVTESDGLNSSSGDMTLNVNFADKSLGGQMDGNLRLPSEFVPVEEYDDFATVYDNYITGEIDGSIEGNQFVGSIAVTGAERGSYLQEQRAITGALGIMGAFHSDGNTAAGAFAGTISETTMGGLFSLDRELPE